MAKNEDMPSTEDTALENDENTTVEEKDILEQKNPEEAGVAHISESAEAEVDEEEQKVTLWMKIKNTSKKTKILSVLGVSLLVLIVLYVVPTTRYAALNAFGEADATVLVVDSESKLPVSGAMVELSDGSSAVTDVEGKAFFNDASYGTTSVAISKPAYEAATFETTISKDNIEVGPFTLVSTGVPVVITAAEWLNGSELAEFSVTDSEGAENAAVEGMVTLNIPNGTTDDQVFSVSAEGYNDQKLIVKTANDKGVRLKPEEIQQQETNTVALVLSGDHYFLSDREGDINFYKSNYDGTSVTKLVETGQDGEYLNYLSVPGRDNVYAVLLSSDKSNERDQLAIVDLETESLTVVDESDEKDFYFRFETVDEDRVLYYVQYTDGRKDNTKLKSYEFDSGSLKSIFTSSNYFNVQYDSERDEVYIAENEQGSNTLLKVSLPSNDKTVLLANTTIYNLQIPTEKPDKLFFNVSQSSKEKRGYYFLDLADNSKKEFLGEDYPDFDEPEEIPDSQKGLASPEGTNRVWIDTRDGKGRIILNETSNVVNGGDTKLSVFSIIRWVDETTLTVTAASGDEAADYIVDIETGEYRKITNTFRQTYYGHGGI